MSLLLRSVRIGASSIAQATTRAVSPASSRARFLPVIVPNRSNHSVSDQMDQILTLSCPDRPGIVHSVTGILAERNMNILDSQQFSDPTTKKFFMRVHFGASSHDSGATAAPASSSGDLQAPFNELASKMNMDLTLRSVSQKPRVLIMVSKIGHCLHDLLYKHSTSQLPIDIPLIVSNHADMQKVAAVYNIPYHHLPVTADTKQEQEAQILNLIKEHQIELVVLARYMQILTPGLCKAMSGRIINIHHSFLPSFKGARPYHQAHERGVKIIGATAHFVTAELDEGPIIEQRVASIDHGMEPHELVEEGSSIESQVLAASVKWFAESRVLLNGHKTVVFK